MSGMIRKYEIMDLTKRMGGRFKLTVLIQKRVQELVHGAAPLVQEDRSRSVIDTAVEEILQGKVSLDQPEEETKSRKKKEA
jgi:DNA-directed RNA polymerase subunit omega